MMNAAPTCYRHTVERAIPTTVRIIQFSLYACVALFTFIGTMQGFIWGVLAVGTLIGSWYYMGLARVNYEYRLDGRVFTVLRHSGMRAHPKTEEFVTVQLDDVLAMGEDLRPDLESAEKLTAQAQPKRITYDVSMHRTDHPAAVMYARGTGKETGRYLKVYFEPLPELKEHFKRICGEERVHLDEIGR